MSIREISKANFTTRANSAAQTGRQVNETAKMVVGYVGAKAASTASSLAGSVFGFAKGLIGKAEK